MNINLMTVSVELVVRSGIKFERTENVTNSGFCNENVGL